MKKLITIGLFTLAFIANAISAIAAVHHDRVYPGQTDSYEMTFRRGQEAKIMVIGDGDNDLDCSVYDENGNLITSDMDGTDQCVMSLTPRWTGTFHIEIENLGQRIPSRYVSIVRTSCALEQSEHRA